MFHKSLRLPLVGALCFVLCTLPAIAHAQDTAKPAIDDSRSNAATRLFIDACVTNIGDEHKVKSWASDHHLRPLQAGFTNTILQGKSGNAWSASNALGDFIVVSEAPAQCSVWARKANSRLSVEHFKKLVDNVKRPGLLVSLNSDEAFDADHSTFHVLTYTIAKDDASPGLMMEAITSESASASAQVRLKLAQVNVVR
jgi:hypothetical protein